MVELYSTRGRPPRAAPTFTPVESNSLAVNVRVALRGHPLRSDLESSQECLAEVLSRSKLL